MQDWLSSSSSQASTQQLILLIDYLIVLISGGASSRFWYREPTDGVIECLPACLSTDKERIHEVMEFAA
ncbi:hypothetical protein OnM2_04374 [Erysiphe neolycopersici]|uniref:Uncharacterized protein n=1 Tax=Erysiphe neolycopersici TaxID=212602 RepID=A0A420I2P6_9PEZI|nr:hypothetical protein OnM2_04374 [Erysiphe neolycopersici]